MRRMIVYSLVAVLAVVSCNVGSLVYELPASTATSLVAAMPTITVTATRLPTVKTTGNVWVRDADGVARGWLYAGQEVLAVCRGKWCVLAGSRLDGLHFWRGCGTDNPAKMGCQSRR